MSTSGAPQHQEPEPPPLGRNRDFTVFWLGQALSVTGGSISLLALPLMVYDATGDIGHLGLLTAVSGATGIVTSTFAGSVVDRTDRRRLMIGCDLLRAVLLCALPLLWLAGPRIWLLYALAVPVAGLKALFDVAYVTAVPGLVPPRDLTAANGRLMSTFALGTLLGPVAAGLITTGADAGWALAVDGATFAVSALSLRWVRFGRHGDGRAAAAARGAGFREMFLTGFRFLWAQPVLRSLTVLLTLLTFITVGATDLLIYRVQEDLGRSAATLGYVIAVSGLGAGAAAFAAGPLRRALGFGTCWLGSTALIGLGVAVTGVSRSLPVVALAAAVFMFGLTLGGVCSMTLRQEITPGPLLGRVTSAFWTVHNASGPAGAVVLTVLAARHGVPAVSLGAGAACLLILAAGLLTPLRGSRPGTAPGPTAPRTPARARDAGLGS
ncbi:MFS transporter [Streptomyces sp. NPDC029003]|uniref:MFS transporter n=1 Tax=Streptomyces sp. NPDC029003 TaxID=3155125 RepID=UPI0033FCC292